MREIGIGLIGTGFMGQAHALAYTNAASVLGGSLRPVLQRVADVSGPAAMAFAAQYGFRSCGTAWREVVADPAVGIVCITTPNTLHREIALAAASAGKHIHCEKPLAPDAREALEMTEAAEATGVRTQVGFNYLKNPVLKLAREMIAGGELGEITGFRGIHAEDYMIDPESPFSWRLEKEGGPGALADLGSHIIAMARFLVGPIESLTADLETVVASRPESKGAGKRRRVEVNDAARLIVRFARGCRGSLEASWVATGRKMHLAFEVSGSKGSLVFTQERLNELLFYKVGGDPRHAGFTRIEAGPQHPPYGRFCVAAGHQLGFNDLKVIEAAEFLAAIAGGPAAGPDFREAYEVQKVVDAAVAASEAGGWRKVG